MGQTFWPSYSKNAALCSQLTPLYCVIIISPMLGHYIKDFDAWNLRKQQIDKNNFEEPLYFKEREVWWISVGVNVGTEIDGKHDLFERPAIIFRKINRAQFYALPITSKDKSGTFYRLVHYGEQSGSACPSQLRAFSAERLLRKIGVVPKKMNTSSYRRSLQIFSQVTSFKIENRHEAAFLGVQRPAV